MRTLIFETSLDGHRPRYLREILVAILESLGSNTDREVVLCLPSSLRNTDPYQEFLQALEPRFTFFSVSEKGYRSGFLEEFGRLRKLSECLATLPSDRVIIPYGDGLIPLIGAMPRWALRMLFPQKIDWETMIFRPNWAYPSETFGDWIYQRLRRWAIGRWSGARLHLADHNAWERVERGIDRYRAQVSRIPEVLESWQAMDRSEALDYLVEQGYLRPEQAEVLARARVIGLPGEPTYRKGADRLIEAVVRHVPGEDVRLLIWGAVVGKVAKRLEARRVHWKEDSRVIVLDREVSDQAFQALFSLTDLICTPYRNHRAVSSLFLNAVIHSKPTISDQRGWLGWAIGKYGHGLGVRSEAPKKLGDCLSAYLDGEQIPLASRSVIADLRRENTAEEFKKRWMA